LVCGIRSGEPWAGNIQQDGRYNTGRKEVIKNPEMEETGTRHESTQTRLQTRIYNQVQAQKSSDATDHTVRGNHVVEIFVRNWWSLVCDSAQMSQGGNGGLGPEVIRERGKKLPTRGISLGQAGAEPPSWSSRSGPYRPRSSARLLPCSIN
jgi:hypothetical protein